MKMKTILLASALMSSFLAQSQSVNLDAYKSRKDKDYLNALIKAQAALPSGGTINLGAGTYAILTPNHGDVAWFLEKSNITLNGAGPGKTFITGGPNIGCVVSGACAGCAPYVKGNTLADSAYTFTFSNNTRKGNKYIVLKNAAWASKISIGQVMTLTAGSHYYNQDFGELVKVIGKNKDTLFLQDAVSGQYAVDMVPYGGTLLEDVVIPPIGKTVTVKVAAINSSSDRYMNIGDNIFWQQSFTDSTMEFLNVGKGNQPAGSVLPAGTHVMKGRTILIWNHAQNVTIQNLTIKGGSSPRVLRGDNKYNFKVYNVDILKETNTPGFIFTNDFSRKVLYNKVRFISTGNNTGSQVSRSSGDITFSKTYHSNYKTDFSEYSFNIRVDSSEYDCYAGNYFIAGNTVRRLFVTNSVFNIIDSMDTYIQSGEVQSLNNVQREFHQWVNNTFNINKWCSVLFDFSKYGQTWYIHNTAQGGAMNFFSGSASRLPDGTGIYPPDVHIDNNTITSRINLTFLLNGLYNGTASGNSVTNGAGRPVMIRWFNASKVTVSDNLFKGFTSPILAPTGVVLVNNTIQ